MQLYTVTTDPMLLEYSLISSAEPITVSPPQGDLTLVTLTLIVSKPKGAQDVQLSSLGFRVPFGDASYDLTPQPVPATNASIASSRQDESWKIEQDTEPGTFIAYPERADSVTISDQSLTIKFVKVQINRAVGTADFTVIETAAAGAGDPVDRTHVKHVPKFPYGFFFNGFSPLTPMVKHNERATLIWHGSVGAKYEMLWGEAPAENVAGKSRWDSPPLTNTTTFLLQVTASIDGHDVEHRAAATVIVENPNLKATDLRIAGTRLGYNDAPNGREFMLYNDDGSDAFPGKVGRVYVGNKAAVLRITEAGDFLFQGPHVGIGTTEPHSALHVNSRDGIRLGLEQNGGGQLVITNNSGDDSIYLESLSKDGKGSAKLMYLGTPGGPNIADLPQLVLRSVNTAVYGTLGIGMGTTAPKNNLDVKGRVVIGASFAGTKEAPGSGLWVEGDVNANQNLWVAKRLTVNGEIWGTPSNADPDGALTLKGLVSCTGRVSSWNPIDMYFPDRKQWYRFAIGHDNWAWLDSGPFSDGRLKEDLRPITGALDKVTRLRGMTYRWSEDGMHALTKHTVNTVSAGPDATEEEHESLRQAERQRAFEKLSGDRIGLVAQEVEAVVPEVVSENEDGHKGIHYQQLVALLVEAIKEQNDQIKALSGEVSALGEKLRDKSS